MNDILTKSVDRFAYMVTQNPKNKTLYAFRHFSDTVPKMWSEAVGQVFEFEGETYEIKSVNDKLMVAIKKGRELAVGSQTPASEQSVSTETIPDTNLII